MSASAFDTHAAVTALRDAGLDEAPAVAIVNTVRDAGSADRDALARKTDIAVVRSEVAGLRSELSIIRRVVGIQSAVTLATFAIVAAKLL